MSICRLCEHLARCWRCLVEGGPGCFSFARGARRSASALEGRNSLPLVHHHARPLLPPVSLEAAPLLHVHEASLALTRSILCCSRLPGSWCNRDPPFQSARVCVAERSCTWQTEFHQHSTRRGQEVLSLSNTCAPLDAGGYHSNDTASRPPLRSSTPTKRHCRPLLVDHCC
jgi:hypothetical protein